MANRIDTVTARNKLKTQREPYWHRISKGCYVGFRKMSDSSSGTWRVRYRDAAGNQLAGSLGTLDEFPAHERFDQAVEAAREWFSRAALGVAGINDHATVMDACNAYVNRIDELKGKAPADDLAYRFRRWVSTDPIADVELQKLTREHLNAFRRRMVTTPVKVNKGGSTRERSKNTVNRDLASLKAALNRAYADRLVTSDFAWREPLKAFKIVGKRRDLYLDREQRRNFFNQAPEDLAAFLRGLSMLPLRPGALAALTVADFDQRLNVLIIGKDKSGQDRKIKLPVEIAKYFEHAVNSKPPEAPLLSRADGSAWNKDAWKWPLKDAARLAGLPLGTTAYTLRHSVISDLVHGGLDLLTVAQISGTSVAMIEKHYGHLRSEVAAIALAKLVL